MKTGLCLAILLIFSLSDVSARDAWFKRVLITNDDGIDDPRLAVLATAFAEVSEVVVVAPLTNCSGSTNYVSAFQRSEVSITPWDLGEDIEAWGVDGFPGDCVLLALSGLMVEAPPDLIVSGVNSGPNLADAYLASGTIGTARLAAQHGIPAIAFSNLDADDPQMMVSVPRWCVALALSKAVRNMGKREYLSVNFPNGPAEEIKGVRWAGLGDQVFHDAFESTGKDDRGRAVWRHHWWFDDGDHQPVDGDVAGQRSGWITVSPMRLGDLDEIRLDTGGDLPRWPKLHRGDR